MKDNLEVLNGINLNVEKFYSISIDIRAITLQGYYNNEIVVEIMAKFSNIVTSVTMSGYVQFDFRYMDTPIKIVLT